MKFVNFPLDPLLIAKNPVNPRDACRLMLVNKSRREIGHTHFFELENLLNANDVLVFNRTKVIKARIKGEIMNKEGQILKKAAELFLVKRIDGKKWRALGKPGKCFKEDLIFVKNELQAKINLKLPEGEMEVEFFNDNVDDLLEKSGEIPLPPYIKDSQAQMTDYQTVYAKAGSSVAAPTAGLHFTKRLLRILKQKGVKMEFIALNIGQGTFATIRTADFREHKMHSEEAEIEKATAKRLNKYRQEGRRIIAVGTTVVRTLEFFSNDDGCISSGNKEVDLFIYPPYKFKFVEAMITNFHLPKSTLLLLTGAFCGTELLNNSYQEALRDNYRFFSFGDAMFIFP